VHVEGALVNVVAMMLLFWRCALPSVGKLQPDDERTNVRVTFHAI
jgi:hypothetical protein